MKYLFLSLFLVACSFVLGPVGSTHEHADFAVYINNERINFALPGYMLKSDYVHLENMGGDKIHKHATGVTLGYFFKTIGVEISSECITIEKKEFCNSNEKSLRFYINGIKDDSALEHEIRDGDVYIISYGTAEEAFEQLSQIV